MPDDIHQAEIDRARDRIIYAAIQWDARMADGDRDQIDFETTMLRCAVLVYRVVRDREIR